MKKTSIVIIAAMAGIFIGSIAQAGSFDGINNRPVPSVGLDHPLTLTPMAQCEVDVSALRSQLSQSQQQVRILQDQVNRLTPGTCENSCVQPDQTEADYVACVEICNTARPFERQDQAISAGVGNFR